MIEPPDNYEEAMKIILHSVEDPYTIHTEKRNRIIAVLTLCAILGILVFAWFRWHSPAVTIFLIPVLVIVSMPFWSLWVITIRTNRQVRTGQFLTKHSRSDIIRIAADYALKNNEFEARRNSR